MNRMAKDVVWSSLQYGGEVVTHLPIYQGVCGWHGTEDLDLNPGELARFPGGTGISDAIREDEVGSEALRVVGHPNNTISATKAVRPENCSRGGGQRRLGRIGK